MTAHVDAIAGPGDLVLPGLTFTHVRAAGAIPADGNRPRSGNRTHGLKTIHWSEESSK
jgi:hypothetical protein